MTVTPPLVSVIVPIFNARLYVSDAVGRLLAQSWPDFELILIDDKSTDGSVVVARDIASREPRVSLIELSENQGVAHARNHALEHARGTYVWFVDIDDEWDPAFLSRTAMTAADSGADAVVCSAVHRFGSDHSTEEYVVRYTRAEVLEGLDAVECVLLGSGALWNKLFRRDALGASPFPPLRSKSDHGGVLGMLRSLHRVAVLPDALYTYVQRDGSISNGGIAQPQNFLALLDIAEDSLSQLPKSPRLRRLRARFRSMIVARALRESWRFPVQAGDLAGRLPRIVRWREIVVTAFTDRRTFLTCAAAKVSPGLARRAFRRIGRSRWTQQGAT